MLLALFNLSMSSAQCPTSWQRATIIPILKKGKPARNPQSYRPVSLTSAVAKLMERLVEARMRYFLEKRNVPAPARQVSERVGRRKNNSVCQDAFYNLEQTLPRRTVLCLLDFSRAYDRVWRVALYHKLLTMEVPGCFVKWVRSFLSDRMSNVK